METAKLYEMIGVKQTKLEELDAAYTELLMRFAGVIKGTIDPSRVLVNLTDRTWIVVEAGCTPGMPAQINGLPE